MAVPARDKLRVAVIGLGYVGLPLAVYLSRHFPVVGFDIDQSRIEQLRSGVDRTRELTAEELTASSRITYSDDTRRSTIATFISSPFQPRSIWPNVRTYLHLLPRAERSGQRALEAKCRGLRVDRLPRRYRRHLRPAFGARVRASSLMTIFFVGYSPERINPGDQAHRLPDIISVTSGSTP